MTRKELLDNIRRKKSFLCVGLDTDIKKIASEKRRRCDFQVQQSNNRRHCSLLRGIQAKPRIL